MSRTMKDSGIPWIGEIPEGWKVCRIKDVAMLYNGNSIKDEEKDNYTNPNNAYPYISTKDLDATYQSIDYCNGLFTSKGDSTFKIAHRDSCLMCIEGGSAGKKKAYVEHDVSFVNKLCCFAPYKIDGKYLFYYLCSPNFESEFYKYISGLIGGVSVSTLKNFMQLLPPLAEQHLIATFLDKKCSEIDSLIELQEQMIEELKAYKQSVITEAVTKGIRNEELGVRNYKDSGIEWIGDVPEEWEVCRIKNVASLFGRIGFRGYTSDDLNKDGEGAITLSPSNMLPMGMDYTNVTYLSWMKYHESPEIMIQNGDILMVKTGSSYGKVSYVDNLPKEATINPQILRIVAKINSKYLGYYLQTPLFIYQVERGVVGGTIPTISQEKINNFFVVIPPLAEQQAIADYLDKKCGEIDELITIKQQKIESLKEYKKSVIYEYVTGKKEP